MSTSTAVSNNFTVGGVQLFSTVDWPDRISATVFLKGCPWRCNYCHNVHLLTTKPNSDDIAWTDVLAQLSKRRGFLDAVVFSGGEPLACDCLSSLMHQVKEMGFLVGLHTNGADSQKLAELLAHKFSQTANDSFDSADDNLITSLESPLLDWVGLDIKAPLAHYDKVTRVRNSAAAVHESLDLLQGAGIDFELRSTLYPEIFDEEAFFQLADELLAAGQSRWVLQRCRDAGEAGRLRELTLPFCLDSVAADLLQRGFADITIR